MAGAGLTGWPAAPTVITFPAGDVTADARVVAVVEHSSTTLVFTDRSPFHPRDPLWPDQPDDVGWLVADSSRHEIVRTVTTARDAGGELSVDDAITARRDDPGVVFDVAHVLGAGEPLEIGAPVRLEVDVPRRRALSAAHTGCHLAAYAVNAATERLWRKDTALDSLGHRDFDAAACVLSRHDLGGSIDTYRLGKSLRKRGFAHDELVAGLDEFLGVANETLRRWLASDASVAVSVAGPHLASRRTWTCSLPDGVASMACGGTHVRRLGELAALVIEGEVRDGGAELVLRARTTLRDP